MDYVLVTTPISQISRESPKELLNLNKIIKRYNRASSLTILFVLGVSKKSRVLYNSINSPLFIFFFVCILRLSTASFAEQNGRKAFENGHLKTA